MTTVDMDIKQELTDILVRIVSETNGISLDDTLELACNDENVLENKKCHKLLSEFRKLLSDFQRDQIEIQTLLNHPVSDSVFAFFKNFPLKYHEEHIHLTGSLSSSFLFPKIKNLLEGPDRKIYESKIVEIYGQEALPIEKPEDIDKLIRLKEGEYFDRYLQILFLPKLVLTSREAHEEAAYHMASELYHDYNVGMIRLKFSLSRSNNSGEESEQIPGIDKVTEEDVVIGLYNGFTKFKKEKENFDFILSPCFRKEPNYFDSSKFETKEDDFFQQVQTLLNIVDKHPHIQSKLCEVDTVGNEKDLYRKSHFNQMKYGFRKLQYKGFKIRSHHGETWYTLKKGIQAVDNAMNIWHIDTLEHGLSLGINPNFYFHSLFQRVLKWNSQGISVKKGSQEYNELREMDWRDRKDICDKLVAGKRITEKEKTRFIKVKFHTAREVEHYQHDVLNRMIHKDVSLTSLPSSNKKLTRYFEDFKDHPFDWWEKKGLLLGVGTDNYITLNTNFIQEMMILLYSDPYNLKITKLLMVTTKESHRPYISQLLWTMRKD